MLQVTRETYLLEGFTTTSTQITLHDPYLSYQLGTFPIDTQNRCIHDLWETTHLDGYVL